jgi:hypothetical protein
MIRLHTKRISVLTAVLAVLGAGSLWIASGQTSPAAAALSGDKDTSLVVAELFTSEGCSSCPPADEILNGLLQRQPFTSLTVLGLSEHVDYWNRDGWVDPFSSADFTKRQLDYRSRAFPGNTVYTPQLVVDGHLEQVGNDSRGVYRTILQGSLVPKANLKLTAAADGSGALQVKVQLPASSTVAVGKKTDVMIAITEDDLEADVHGGENGGRHLKHNGVVRKLVSIATIEPAAKSWSGSTSIPLAPEWKPANLKVIAFLQEQESRRIIGTGLARVDGLTAAP